MIYRPDQCVYCGRETWCDLRKHGPTCRGCRAVWFFEYVLFRPKGFSLLPWQAADLRAIYGTVDHLTGLRQYLTGHEQIPKKNGKSFMAGGMPLYHLIDEVEDRKEAYGAASSKDQAGIVFRSAVYLITGNALLLDRLRVGASKKLITLRNGNGFYQVISADGDYNDGCEPSLAIRDEVHRWRTQKAQTLYDILGKGTISRREPFCLDISTAGEIGEAPIWERETEYAEAVAAGAIESPSHFVRIYSADKKRIVTDKSYWKSREARVTANPSHEEHGGFLKDARLVAEMNKALTSAREKANYLRYHLNIWGQNELAAVDLEDWNKGDGELGRLIDRTCYLGVDLSLTTDLSAVAALFPPADNDPFWDLKVALFMPEEAVKKRAQKDRVPYQDWIDQGLIETCSGDVIDTVQIADKIEHWCELHAVEETLFDRYNSRQISVNLIGRGFKCSEVQQSFQGLSEATKTFLTIVKQGKLRHAGNPALKWMAGSATTVSDKHANIMFAKPDTLKSSKRIDGLTAAVFAMTKAMIHQPMGDYIAVI